MAEVYLSNKMEELEKFLNIVSEAILQGNMSLFLGPALQCSIKLLVGMS